MGLPKCGEAPPYTTVASLRLGRPPELLRIDLRVELGLRRNRSTSRRLVVYVSDRLSTSLVQFSQTMQRYTMGIGIALSAMSMCPFQGQT